MADEVSNFVDDFAKGCFGSFLLLVGMSLSLAVGAFIVLRSLV